MCERKRERSATGELKGSWAGRNNMTGISTKLGQCDSRCEYASGALLPPPRRASRPRGAGDPEGGTVGPGLRKLPLRSAAAWSGAACLGQQMR